MKDTEIVEVLADGTVYHFDLDVCNAEAEQVLETLWAKEDKLIGFDYTATIYSLFARSIQILSYSGWSAEELLDAVLTHHSDEDEEDDVDE
jgi:hypothetical protein